MCLCGRKGDRLRVDKGYSGCSDLSWNFEDVLRAVNS